MHFPRILLAAIGAAILLPSALAQTAKCPTGQREHKDDNGKLWCIDSEGRSFAAREPQPQKEEPTDKEALAAFERENLGNQAPNCPDPFWPENLMTTDDFYKLGVDGLSSKDYAMSVCWARLGARQGDRRALRLLGIFYSKPEFTGYNQKVAFRYFLWAADKGDVQAEYLLSLAYTDGIGTQKDVGNAVWWMDHLTQSDEGRALVVRIQQQDGVRAQQQQINPWPLLRGILAGADGGDDSPEKRLDLCGHPEFTDVCVQPGRAKQLGVIK
jgi:hypothetical protein